MYQSWAKREEYRELWAYAWAGVDVQRPEVDSECLPQPLFTSLRQSLLLNPELTIQLPLESHLALGISYLLFQVLGLQASCPVHLNFYVNVGT